MCWVVKGEEGNGILKEVDWTGLLREPLIEKPNER